MAGSVRITKLYRYSLFALVLTSWTSGVSFFILNRWVSVEGDFGPEKHPWQFNILEIHGAAAFLMMLVFGALLAAHVPVGWRVQRVRPLGLALVIALALLMTSAHFLYYLGDEEFRQWTAYVHAAIGFSLPFILIAHLWQGSKRRRRRKS